MRVKMKLEMDENPLKDVFFPVKKDILFTVGRRTDKGVARGDACCIEHGNLCEALLRAGEDEDYHFMPVKGYQNTFVQMVSPESSKEERADEMIGGNLTVKDMNGIFSGGFGNLDAMISQHPNGWNYFDPVGDMKEARAISGRSNFVWGYLEAAETKGIDISCDYTWQDMVNSNEPWNWSLLEVFPSGETREILKVGEVPGSLIHDAVLISVGKGINPYSPEKYACVIVGGRGGSTALGGMIFDRDEEQLNSIKGASDILEEIDWIVESRPESTKSIQLVVTDWLENGQVVKAGDVVAYNG